MEAPLVSSDGAPIDPHQFVQARMKAEAKKWMIAMLSIYALLFAVPGVYEIYLGALPHGRAALGTLTLGRVCLAKGLADLGFAVSASVPALGVLCGAYTPIAGASSLGGLLPRAVETSAAAKVCVLSTLVARVLQRAVVVLLVVAAFSARGATSASGPEELRTFAWWWFYAIPAASIFGVPLLLLVFMVVVTLCKKYARRWRYGHE
mmetsp:Transcript_75111/g.220115  ORF Transcript_75111/g.220115 Transcript_75111/m.220115 type:complete len:206 (+) Transcript_75111:90-707(+)